MNPSGAAFFGSATLNALRLLASALATSSTLSGRSVRLFGVFPFGADGCSAQLMVWIAARLSRSKTLTWVELAHATYRAFARGSMTISVGCGAVAIVFTTALLSRSTTATRASAHRLTNKNLPSGCGRQA